MLEQSELDSASAQVYAFIKKLVGDEKEANNVLRIVLERFSTQRDISNFETPKGLAVYLRLLARNCCIDFLREKNYKKI